MVMTVVRYVDVKLGCEGSGSAVRRQVGCGYWKLFGPGREMGYLYTLSFWKPYTESALPPIFSKAEKYTVHVCEACGGQIY